MELKDRTIESLLDELEMLIRREHALYLFELERYTIHKQSIIDEIIRRATDKN